jgi:hypothetical protein
MSLKMHKPDWKEAYEIAYDELSALHPEYHGDDLDRLASEEADDYIANWADMMIDRAKDEQMMDEGGASQARKPKDKQ